MILGMNDKEMRHKVDFLKSHFLAKFTGGLQILEQTPFVLLYSSWKFSVSKDNKTPRSGQRLIVLLLKLMLNFHFIVEIGNYILVAHLLAGAMSCVINVGTML